MKQHVPVLLEEALSSLAIKADGIYLDGTFGRGGHSQAILQRLGAKGRLIAIDKDEAALSYAQEHLGQDARFSIYQGSFANMAEFAREAGVLGQVNGILLDLGLSSPQLDEAERGFSFMQEGPLDMRMDVKAPMSAANFVNEASVEKMAQVFRTYGEERFAGRIAKAIDLARKEKAITSTLQLAEIVKAANPKWEKHKHPATRVFQAIRIEVNQELIDLEAGLEQSLSVLAKHGRLVVISFHSLEDRIVKQFMRHKEQGDRPPPEVPIRYEAEKAAFKRIGKAVMPGEAEVTTNVRARSAVLRTGEKLL